MALWATFPSFLLAAVFRNVRFCLSNVFENQDAAVVQFYFGCLPRLVLVEPVWVGIGWIPGAVEPIEVGLFVGDPFFERLPRRSDRLHSLIRLLRTARSPFGLRLRLRLKASDLLALLDVDGWGCGEELDEAFPQTMGAEEELRQPQRTPSQSAFGLQGMLIGMSNEHSIY